MAINKKGVFTLPTLMQFNTEANINLEAVFKRSAIFFDQIILSEVIPTKFKFLPMGAHNFRGSLIPIIKSKLDRKFANSSKFNEIFGSTKEYDDFFNYVKEEAQKKAHLSALDENIQKFMNYVINLPNTEVDRESKLIANYMNMDFIYNDHLLYSNLSKHHPDYSGILSPKMGKVLKNVLDKSPLSETKLTEMVSKEFVDFGQLSWDEIIKLRRSGLVNDFRKKVDELFTQYQNLKDIDEVNKKINTYIINTMISFMKKKRPNLKKTAISGICGTVSMPYSIFATMKGMKDDLDTKKKYDWLYLIIDAQ